MATYITRLGLNQGLALKQCDGGCNWEALSLCNFHKGAFSGNHYKEKASLEEVR